LKVVYTVNNVNRYAKVGVRNLHYAFSKKFYLVKVANDPRIYVKYVKALFYTRRSHFLYMYIKYRV